MDRPIEESRAARTDAWLLVPSPCRDALSQTGLDVEVLAAALRAAGFAVEITAGLAPPDGDVDALLDRAKLLHPRLIYWHLTSRADLEPAVAAALRLRRAVPEVPQLAGGELATWNDLALLQSSEVLDAAVRGEPEETLAAVLGQLVSGGPWGDEAGLSLRRGGEARRNPPRPLPASLDHLPPAASDLWLAADGGDRRLVLLNRGCASDCQYCGLQVPYREDYAPRTDFWRTRSPRAVAEEIEGLHRERGVTRFHLSAFAAFGHGPAGGAVLEELAREILRRDLRIELSFVASAGAFYEHRQLLPLLAEAGLTEPTVGIDSGLDRVLDLFQVGFGPEAAHGALSALHELEIPFHTAFVFYEPYVSLDEIRRNLDFLRPLAPLYGHQPLPFAFYLDREIVNTVLSVKTHMPIYRRLLDDGLATAVDPLAEAPRAGFRDPATGRFFRLHQALNRTALGILRPFLYHPKVVGRFPHLDTFPVDLLTELADHLSAAPESGDDEILAAAGSWVRDQLEAEWEEMIVRVGATAEHRPRLDAFMASLGRRETVVAPPN